MTLTHDKERPVLGIPGLNRLQLFISSTFRSGQRYTPVEFRGQQVNPFTGERDWRPIYETNNDPAKRFSEIGKPWWWFDLNAQRSIAVLGNDLVISLAITNLFNQLNSIIVNPVTGEAYPDVDAATTDFIALRGNADYDVPIGTRDPRYEDPNTEGLPPFNPARFLPQRHVVFGLSYRF